MTAQEYRQQIIDKGCKIEQTKTKGEYVVNGYAHVRFRSDRGFKAGGIFVKEYWLDENEPMWGRYTVNSFIATYGA